MRYTFHGHASAVELKDILAFEPELTRKCAKAQREPDVEEAVAVVLDFFGATYVREQAAHLEVIARRWVQVAGLAQTENEKDKVRAIPERLGQRFDGVWREGRAALHLMLRAVALREGCEMREAVFYVDPVDVSGLLESLVDGLRRGYAASLDAAFVVELLERAQGIRETIEPNEASRSRALDYDWAAEVTGPRPFEQVPTTAP